MLGDGMSDQKKLRVVIIDDYDMTRSLLRIILRGQAFDVVGEASDGKAGLELCAKVNPDIVFLDVVMPGMNGLDMLKELRIFAGQPMVIMVTGSDDESVVKRAMSEGASGFIVKPFNTESVTVTVNQARDAFVLREAAKIKN
jgi:two-component system, chemotaxis family, chemotaxis protein CheY